MLASSLYAQTINPRQYVVIKNEQIARPASKAKDGTYLSPNLYNDNDLLFTPNNEYLYILNTDKESEGKFVVYDIAKRNVVKTFKLPKTGTGYKSRFAFNPLNIHQLALTVNKSEIIVLPDWRTELDNAFDKKKTEGSNRITITGKMEGTKFAFSTDAKSLYLAEYKADQLKVVELASGTAVKKSLPKGKNLHACFANFGTLDEGTPFMVTMKPCWCIKKTKKPLGYKQPIFIIYPQGKLPVAMI